MQNSEMEISDYDGIVFLWKVSEGINSVMPTHMRELKNI